MVWCAIGAGNSSFLWKLTANHIHCTRLNRRLQMKWTNANVLLQRFGEHFQILIEYRIKWLDHIVMKWWIQIPSMESPFVGWREKTIDEFSEKLQQINFRKHYISMWLIRGRCSQRWNHTKHLCSSLSVYSKWFQNDSDHQCTRRDDFQAKIFQVHRIASKSHWLHLKFLYKHINARTQINCHWENSVRTRI